MNLTLPLALWLHDLDKMAFHASWLPNQGLAWYGLSYLAGFVAAWMLLKRVLAVGATPLGLPFDKDAAGDLVMTGAMGVLIGGRLGYCVFYEPHLWVDFSNKLPFWGVLAIHKGGMASHGGMIGALVAGWWWGRKHKAPLLYLFDLVAFAAPLGLCFGRLANFVNGELYGRACDASYALAVQFPQEIAGDWRRDGNVDGEKKYRALMAALPEKYLPGVDAEGHRDLHTLDELGMKAKNDPALAQILHDHLTPRHPSQLYAAALEGLLLFVVLFIVYRKPRSPGLIAGLFGILYACARVGDEFFRMPDAQFIKGEALPKVTQGQLLSFFVFAVGVMLVFIASKSEKKKLGGWQRQAPAVAA